MANNQASRSTFVVEAPQAQGPRSATLPLTKLASLPLLLKNGTAQTRVKRLRLRRKWPAQISCPREEKITNNSMIVDPHTSSSSLWSRRGRHSLQVDRMRIFVNCTAFPKRNINILRWTTGAQRVCPQHCAGSIRAGSQQQGLKPDFRDAFGGKEGVFVCLCVRLRVFARVSGIHVGNRCSTVVVFTLV